jgi:hypothetical protein
LLTLILTVDSWGSLFTRTYATNIREFVIGIGERRGGEEGAD